jgi:hypothetical protein
LVDMGLARPRCFSRFFCPAQRVLGAPLNSWSRTATSRASLFPCADRLQLTTRVRGNRPSSYLKSESRLIVQADPARSPTGLINSKYRSSAAMLEAIAAKCRRTQQPAVIFNRQRLAMTTGPIASHTRQVIFHDHNRLPGITF